MKFAFFATVVKNICIFCKNVILLTSKTLKKMDKNAAISKQLLFLKRIEDLVGNSSSLVYELSEILEISTDSAYRRMRGETFLGIDEIIALCDHYNISFDAFSKAETEIVTFSYKGMENVSENLSSYLKEIRKDLTNIKAAKSKQIVYACQDIPVFYHYHHHELATFKFFYWMRSIMNVSSSEFSKYNPMAIDAEIFDIARDIYRLYASVPSIEIWTDTTIQSTLKQIEFYWESGIFNNKEEALLVCASLKEEIIDIQKQAETNKKMILDNNSEELQNNYALYYSEIEITNNCVLVSIEDFKAVYLSHFSFYTMKTMNENYCLKTEKWLQSLIKKTTLISGVSEKTRFKFFNKAFQKIDELIKNIKES